MIPTVAAYCVFYVLVPIGVYRMTYRVTGSELSALGCAVVGVILGIAGSERLLKWLKRRL
jgi:hypothetical protein